MGGGMQCSSLAIWAEGRREEVGSSIYGTTCRGFGNGGGMGEPNIFVFNQNRLL
jgi:hypothetical protein